MDFIIKNFSNNFVLVALRNLFLTTKVVLIDQFITLSYGLCLIKFVFCDMSRPVEMRSCQQFFRIIFCNFITNFGCSFSMIRFHVILVDFLGQVYEFLAIFILN